MKILFFVQDMGLGGVLRQVSILADRLTRKGHEVFVVGMVERDENWKLVWESDVKVSALWTEKASDPLSRAKKFIHIMSSLRRLLKKENFEILYSFQGQTARFISWLASRGLTGTKLIWGVRGSGVVTHSYNESLKRFLLLFLSRWASRSVYLTISNSQAAHANQTKRRSRCRRHIVIDNGFDVEKFKPDPEARMRVRSEWKVADAKLIGIVARLAVSKGHRIFVEAAAMLGRERKDMRFVIVGEGGEKRSLDVLSQELGIAENLIWAGARRDMPAVYNALDVLCSASIRGEGFSNVIGEAMACGVPCVVTRMGDSARIVGDLGIAVAPGDARALARAWAAMLATLDRIERRQLRDRIVKQFSLEAMVEATEKALIEVAEGARID